MKRVILLTATLSFLISSFAHAGSDCPKAQQDAIWVPACQLGDDIHVLYYNSNDYSAMFSVKITYSDERGMTKTKWFNDETASRSYGGELGGVRVRNCNGCVQDVELRNVKAR